MSEEKETPKPQQTPAPNGYIPGEPKKGLAEQIRIYKERRLLRKDLKSKGITSREDFEAIAQSLGLVPWKGIPLFMWLRHVWGNLLAGLGLKTLLFASGAVLTGLFLISTVTESKGSFTINLTADMLRAGFVLSESEDFNREQSRLFSDRLLDVTNITLSDIQSDVDEIDGPHNGPNYLAYTFYIRNRGDETNSYAWYVRMVSETMSVSNAVWMMIFEDGRQVVYARPAPDGRPEELYGFHRLHFADVAYDYEYQYYQKDGLFGIVTTPYVDEKTVAQGIIHNVEPGEAHKYTIVIWVEGHDPECTDDLFGGYAKFEMEFANVTSEDEGSIFDGVYRTEYEDYGQKKDEEE